MGLGYTIGEVARILELTPGQVRASLRAGLLDPARGPRGEFRFSFEDLTVLKTARELLSARLPSRRVRGTLEKLRSQLARGRRLSGLRIGVEAGAIVVADGRARWQPESGQILLDFDRAGPPRAAAPATRPDFQREGEPASVAAASAEELYRRGCDLEAASPGEAEAAYREALALDPAHADAHVNLGRLLQETGDPAAAEEHYRHALAARPGDTTAAFNLGVALEDLARPADALAAYESAVAADPSNADAHYNAASLCERLGRPADALRHLKEYRVLTRGN